MLDKEYAVNMLTALVDAAEEMDGHGIKAKCLAVNDAVFDTIRGLITYLQNSEEVVRCKDCVWHGDKYCNNLNVWGFKDGDYCSFGRRRETEDEHDL